MSKGPNSKNDVLDYAGARAGSVTDLADGSLQGQNRTSGIMDDAQNRVEIWNEKNPLNKITNDEVKKAITEDIVRRVAEVRKLDVTDPEVRQEIFESERYTALSGVRSAADKICPE
ncbi:hypothetical protein [Gluconobacter cadivus]|uniref:Uncharacterized protein n=1 Tax=Gluconobacter cadivus TaxID=2728101 RepID=A0ABR9YY84_9PROT|nr:hypothetical protein [Gluconobacter cadivus]MBF0889510.1 hypothetical protein [Gluconobacter cadivus]